MQVPKGMEQVSERVSVPCWLANAPWKPLVWYQGHEIGENPDWYGIPVTG